MFVEDHIHMMIYPSGTKIVLLLYKQSAEIFAYPPCLRRFSSFVELQWVLHNENRIEQTSLYNRTRIFNSKMETP